MQSSSHYDRIAMLLHWIIALLMIYMVFFGEDLMNRNETTPFYASIHTSIGIAILVLSVVRLLWRLLNPPPPPPASMKGWEIKLSKATHFIFYLAMIGLPLTGLLGFAHFAGRAPQLAGATFFDLIPVPQIVLVDSWNWGGLHGFIANAMILLIALHVLAVLKHQFIDRDGVLKRMM